MDEYNEAPSHHAPTCQCRECRGPTPSRFEQWRAGWRAALVDIRQDTRQRDFRIVAGTAFLTFAYLGRNWYVGMGPFKTVTKVLAGTLLTTMITYYILLPVLGLRAGEGFGDDMMEWIRKRKYDYSEWAIGRIETKERKKQIKADAFLRQRLIARILKVNAYLPLPLNYCYQGPAGVNPNVSLYQRASREDIEKDVDKMMVERHGGVYGVDRYEKWEQSLPPL